MQLRLKSNVFLVKSVAYGTVDQIESDYQRLKQVLINILRNSTKFTFKGYIQIGARNALLKASKKGRVVAILEAIEFECFDTGIGISEENQ